MESVSTTNPAMGARASPSAWAQHLPDLPPLTPKPFYQGSQPFHCCVCEEPFFDRDLLLIHEETHVPEAPFVCRFCTTPYTVLDDFRSHVNIHRINLRNPPNVGQRQSQSGIRISSQGPIATKRVMPSVDGANANQSQPFVPSGDSQYPYKCVECKSNFQRHQLYYHMRAYHAPTSTKKNIPSVDATNASLNQNKPFVPSDDSEYPYKCVECKTNFQKHQLYAHMKVHLKQKNIFSKKSLKCDECGKIFEKELTLKKHMDTAHPSAGKSSPLLDALQPNAQCSSPSEPTVVKQEPESSLGDDEINSTVSDNPILTQLLNNNSEQTYNSTSTTGTGTPVNELSSDGGFIISAVATVDQSFLEQLDKMERVQKEQGESEQDQEFQQEEQEQDVQQVQSMPPLRRMPVLEERYV